MTHTTDRGANVQIAGQDEDFVTVRASRRRRAAWDDWALPASVAFAVVTALLIHYPPDFPVITTASAADPAQADYLMTITAKRLPVECRGSSQHAVPTGCAPYLAGDAVVDMRETGASDR